jgi:hypothetical protein
MALGHPLVDEYLVFAGARLRRNSWLAVAYDLKVFFCTIGKDPAAVTTKDVFSCWPDSGRGETVHWRHIPPPTAGLRGCASRGIALAIRAARRAGSTGRP